MARTIDAKSLRHFMDPTAAEEEVEQAFMDIHSTVAQDSAVLMGLIMQLESFLTSSDDKERNRATLLLAKLLETQQEPLTASQIHHFCVFFNSRVADYPSLAPCLCAIRGLLEHQWQHFDEKYQDVSDIFDTLFREIEVQDLPQSIRSRVFSLLQELLSCTMAVSAMQPRGLCVIQGVLNAVEGEKDPRCLLQSFKLVALLFAALPADLFREAMAPPAPPAVSSFKDGADNDLHETAGYTGAPAVSHGERIFNIMACYFPITFNPPPGDPHGITPPMLIQSLKHALCDDAHVASFVIPFLMDQLLAPPETVCRSHALLYLHYLVKQHSNMKMRAGGSKLAALPAPLLLVLSQLSESLYDIALEDTTSLPLLTIGSDAEEGEEDAVVGARGGGRAAQTLADQAVEFTNLVCKQIGNSDNQGELLWSQFGEPMLSEVVKNTRKSVQNLTTKANMKVALAMASSTFRITSTIMDRLVPVLLGHIRPVLQASMSQNKGAAAGDSEPVKLLQHDLERKHHDVNSAAVGLLYLAQLISCNLDFNLDFSQYGKRSAYMTIGADDTDSEDLQQPPDESYEGLFSLLHEYCVEMFQFNGSTSGEAGTGMTTMTNTDRSNVGLYAGCLKCLQTIIAAKLRSSSITAMDRDRERALLQLVTLNSCVPETSTQDSTDSYDWSADVRQASLLFVSHCRKLYLQPDMSNELCEFGSAVFEEGCLLKLQAELAAEPFALRLRSIFNVISHLLSSFAANHKVLQKQLQKEEQSWYPLDNQLLSTVLSCITSSPTTDCLDSDSSSLQNFALDALLRCLPAAVTDPSKEPAAVENTKNFIANSLVARIAASEGGDDASDCSTNLEKLVKFAIVTSHDDKTVALVSQIVHRVLVSLAGGSPDNLHSVVQRIINSCSESILAACAEPPTAILFSHKSVDTINVATNNNAANCNDLKNQAARVLLAVLNVLSKEHGVWAFMSVLGAEHHGADAKYVALWAQLMNVLFSNMVLRDENASNVEFSATCSRIMAVVLNKSAMGANLEVLLQALDNLVVACMASAASIPLSTQESVVQGLMAILRALIMRRNIAITAPQSSIKTWQDKFMGLLMDLVTGACEGVGPSPYLTLALVSKHLKFLSCHHQDGFLYDKTSNCTSMMWRQKLWHKLSPVLTSGVQRASALCGNDDDNLPIAALLALCSLASEMPFPVVQEHIPSLISFSVQALMVNDPKSSSSKIDVTSGGGGVAGDEDAALTAHVKKYLRDAAVQCLLSAFQSTSPVLVEALMPHISTLVPLLLQGCQAKATTTLAATRAGCVQCLFYMAGGDMCQRFQYHTLHPMKRLVVRGLAIVLNDKKQAVRRWAAKVRNLWISLKE